MDDPVFVDPLRGPWPLHDTPASRAAEAAGLAATAPHALMQRAGFALARLAVALAPHARRVHVLAGPGNNGGDGLVAACHLHRAGFEVRVQTVGRASKAPPDAADALQRAREAGVPITTETPPGEPELLVDALLGLGSTRTPEGAVAEAVRRLNAASAPVLAVDLPTGLDADTGQPLGDDVVRADWTLSLLTLKPGLFTGQGRDFAGAVWWHPLGVAATGATAQLAGAPATPPRRHAQHKGSFGDVAVVGGAPGMGGALLLAARAALAAGAGRVYASALDEQAPLLDPAHPELMLRRRWWASPPSQLAAATVVCGCGGGDAVREVLPALLSGAGRLVLDADALNAVAADTALQALLAARADRGRPTVLTPHPLEAARLLGLDTQAVQADRLAAAAALCSRFRCVVVLKGSGSVVAAPGLLPSINPTGNALLASAGTGDVLAGWLGGLLAQDGDARRAAVEAVWRHGRAADLAAASGRRQPFAAGELVGAMGST